MEYFLKDGANIEQIVEQEKSVDLVLTDKNSVFNVAINNIRKRISFNRVDGEWSYKLLWLIIEGEKQISFIIFYYRIKDKGLNFQIANPYSSRLLMSHWMCTICCLLDFCNPLCSVRNLSLQNGLLFRLNRKLDFWLIDGECTLLPLKDLKSKALLSYYSSFALKIYHTRTALSVKLKFEVNDKGKFCVYSLEILFNL